MNLEPSPKGLLAICPAPSRAGRVGPGGGPTVHFRTANGDDARLLVRWLIPDAGAGGHRWRTSAPAHVNYASLIARGQTARIRLNSTVVHVQHQGDVAARGSRDELRPRR